MRCWFSREARILGGVDALREQPHPVLLLHANDLVFRASRPAGIENHLGRETLKSAEVFLAA